MKKFIALFLAVSLCLVSGTTAFAAKTTATLAVKDGNAYFYFAASNLSVEAPNNAKNAFSVNGGALTYITSNITSHTERIDKSQLIPRAVNTITIYTGNQNGIINEKLSRNDAGTDCDEFEVNPAQLWIILPDATIVGTSHIYTYTPLNANDCLDVSYNKAEYTDAKAIRMGDTQLTFAYKIELVFDLTNIAWDPSYDITPIIPDIKNVSLQIGAEPSLRNIVWYSTSQNNGVVQLAKKADMAGNVFPENPETFSATSENTGLTGYKSYKATMSGLSEDTEYVYRVGNEADGWSDVYSFKTQSFDGDFSFVVISDPQLGQGTYARDIQDEISWWTDSVDKISANFTDASFLASMGDQVAQIYSDSQFDAFFTPEKLKSLTLSVIPGNHDVGSNYTPHYNMPNVSPLGVRSPMGAGSGDYYFTYGDALFMGINCMSKAYDEHIQFLEETMKKNPAAKWKIIMIHYGFYGATDQSFRTEDIVNLRIALAPVFSRLGIDVVLDGHEHCYSRSYFINANEEIDPLSGGNSITDPDSDDVFYVTLGSASGTDYVSPINTLDFVAKISSVRVPHISRVDITDSSFTIDTYRTDNMNLVDTFTIHRTDAPVVDAVFVSSDDSVVKTGGSKAFSAQIFGYNHPSEEVIWSVSGNENPNTSIDANGVLSVDIDETAQSLVVQAISAVNNAKYDQVTIPVESNIVQVNVGKGLQYALPATIDGKAVTWQDAAGSIVTQVDTSKVGYLIYTGTIKDESSAIVKYRYNVGEYKVLMQDDFENYQSSQYQSAISQKIEGGSFSKTAYADNNSLQLTTDGNNTVAAFGPNVSSNLTSFMWTPNDKAIGEAFRVSYKIRTNSINTETAYATNNLLFLNNFGNTAGIQITADVSDGNVTKTWLVCQGTTNVKADISNYVNWTKSGDIASMEEYITVDFEGNNTQYSVRVNGVEIANSVVYSGANINTGGVASIRWAKRASSTGIVDAVTYADEMVYSKAVYVTDFLKNMAVKTTLSQGDSNQQTTTVALRMSDNTTRDFTVNYTADTLTTGEKTAIGTIEGFHDTILVNYTVNECAIVAQGVTYALPTTIDGLGVTWKDAAGNTVTHIDTQKVGYRRYTGNLADEASTKVEYRVNVGEYKVLMEDTLEQYTEEQYLTRFSQKIEGGTFYKGAWSEDTDAQQLSKDGSNTVAALGPAISQFNSFAWTPKDPAIGGAFKVSYKIRTNSLNLNTAKATNNFLFGNNYGNTAGIQITADVSDGNVTKTWLVCQGTNEVKADISSYVNWTKSGNIAAMEEYITVDFEGNSTQYSVRVNGVEIANSVVYKGTLMSTGGVASIRWAKRASSTGIVDAVTYADEMVYSKVAFVSDVLKNKMVEATLLPGASAAQTATVTLNMSDGTTKNFTVNYIADTADSGVKTTTGTIDGFDDVIPVTYTVKGCVVDSIVTDGTSVTQVLIKNDSTIDDTVTLFLAAYDAQTRVMKRGCEVELTDEQLTEGSHTITLPDALTAEAGSLIRAFLWNDQLTPLAVPGETIQQN